MAASNPYAPTYSDLLRDPRWQKKRLKIMERDDWRCRECRDSESNLQVHHKRYARGKMPWEYADTDLVTLCHRCHERVTELRKKANDLLSDLSLYELPIVVQMIESIYESKPTDEPPAMPMTPPPAPPRQLIDRGRALALLEQYEEEKTALIKCPWSEPASRRIDELDGLASDLWDSLAGAA